jgi:hypothetical protein
VLFAATTGVEPELLRANRGWSEDDWAAAAGRLRERGLLGDDGLASITGSTRHDEIEQRTDELAVQPYRALTAEELDDLLRDARRLSNAITASGDIPFPNPMGLPPPDRGSPAPASPSS